MKRILTIVALIYAGGTSVLAQPEIDESQPGAWYMYFFTKKFDKSRIGIQGDYQFRFWDAGNDLEQLLLRTGITYSPQEAGVMFTAGYGYISTGEFGEGRTTVPEHRTYQEALLPQKAGSRFYLIHRFRYEQRWVENQNFRTRYRYNLFLNVPINTDRLVKKAYYVAVYNEIFINGERNIGDNRNVEIFDRNRTYFGLGYGLRDNLRVQLGWMAQTTDQWRKNQVQVSMHHNW